jgi:fucose permease
MPWLLIGVTFISMIVFGFAENIKGPVIPPIRETFGVSYGAIGVMLFIASLGYLSTTFIGGFAGDRFGQKAVLAVGYGLIILAGLGMTQAQSFLVVCVLMYTLNAGFGCLEVGVNALGAQVFVRNAALMMNLVHLFYGAGSMVGPEYAAWMLVQGRLWSDVYGFGILLVLALFLVMMLVRFPRAPQKHGEQRIGLRQIARDKKVLAG